MKEQDRGAQSLMTVEESAKGRVAWSVYKAYIRAMSVSGAAATVCLVLVATAFDVGEHQLARDTGLAAVSLGGWHAGLGVWLKVWSSAAEDQGDDVDMIGYLDM